jgi:hypothetical protein
MNTRDVDQALPQQFERIRARTNERQHANAVPATHLVSNQSSHRVATGDDQRL